MDTVFESWQQKIEEAEALMAEIVGSSKHYTKEEAALIRCVQLLIVGMRYEWPKP